MGKRKGKQKTVAPLPFKMQISLSNYRVVLHTPKLNKIKTNIFYYANKKN